MNIKSNFQEINVDALKVDYSYQREPNPNKVKKIANKWDDEKANVVHVSHRNDGYYVIDGNHTRLAYKSIGGGNILCCVHENLTEKEEATMFVELNTSQTKPNFNQILKAKAEAGVEPESSYLSLLAKVGAPYTLMKGKNGKISCHDALLAVYKSTTPTLMERALRTALHATSERDGFYRVGYFPGLCSLVTMHPDVDDSRLIYVIKNTSLSKITDYAEAFRGGLLDGGYGRTKQFRKAYLALYNKGLKKNKIMED